MNPSLFPRLRRYLWLCALLPWVSVHADTPRNTPAETVTYHPRYMAYAAVEPLRQLTIRADHAGYLKDLTLRPGDRLRSGTPFARLIGPAITAALRQAEITLVETRRRATLAADSLRSAQRTYPAFTNRRELNAAKAAVASAHAALQQAKTALDSLRARVVLRSPANGQVTALRAANGERVTPGSPILTLLPGGGLWLRAAYYGSDSQKIALGMRGRFIPADGNPPIAVRVIRKIPPIQADGAQGFGLLAISTTAWADGERGRVELEGPARQAVAVPTSALILDQGQWWVLTLQQGQPQRTPVTPGPARGARTLIISGLAAGTPVVVQNAYLIFHRDFAAHYTPPD